jgi:hypothetical protein
MMNGGPFVPPPRPIAPRFEPLPPETWGAEGSAFPGVPPMPPTPMPEIAPYHPYRPPGFLDRVLGTAGQTQFYGQIPPGVMLPALLLKTIAGMRGHKLEREEMERQELNRRGELAATARNQANLEASRVERSRRFAMEDRVLAARDRATERATERTADTEQREHDAKNKRLTPSEAAALRLPLESTLMPVRELPEEYRSRIAPLTSMVTVAGPNGQPVTVPATSVVTRPRPIRPGRIGPSIPSLSAAARAMTVRIAQLRTNYQDAEADSLQGLASEIDRIHAAIREAQTPDDVDSIEVPDTLPRETKADLASAARLRKEQFGNAR